MIIDRLILFFFGRGPQANDEKSAQAHRGARGKAGGRGGSSGGGEGAGGRFKRTTDRLKNITRRRSANQKADDGKSVRGGAGAGSNARRAKRKTTSRSASGTRSTARAKAKPKSAAVKKSVAKKTAAPKKVVTAPRKASKVRKKSKTRDIHVVFRAKEKLWSLLREGSSRADSLYLYQEDAIEAGRSRAQFEEVELIIHRKDGSIRA